MDSDLAGMGASLSNAPLTTRSHLMSDPRSANTLKLSVMMFLQFFTWGAWFGTLGLCLLSNQLGDFSAGSFGSAPLGAMIAPLFLGLIADRFSHHRR